MSKNILSPEAELSIISKSLRQATNIKTGASKYYIIWGAILFIFYVSQSIAFYYKVASINNLSMLLFPIGGIASYIQSKKDDKKETLIPINEKLYSYSWIGASISMGVLCIGNFKNFIEILCIGTLVIFGLINYVIGGVTKFRPLIIGGLVSIILAIFIPNIDIAYKYLLTAIGILFSCLIPGILMKKTDANV